MCASTSVRRSAGAASAVDPFRGQSSRALDARPAPANHHPLLRRARERRREATRKRSQLVRQPHRADTSATPIDVQRRSVSSLSATPAARVTTPHTRRRGRRSVVDANARWPPDRSRAGNSAQRFQRARSPAAEVGNQRRAEWVGCERREFGDTEIRPKPRRQGTVAHQSTGRTRRSGGVPRNESMSSALRSSRAPALTDDEGRILSYGRRTIRRGGVDPRRKRAHPPRADPQFDEEAPASKTAKPWTSFAATASTNGPPLATAFGSDRRSLRVRVPSAGPTLVVDCGDGPIQRPRREGRCTGRIGRIAPNAGEGRRPSGRASAHRELAVGRPVCPRGRTVVVVTPTSASRGADRDKTRSTACLCPAVRSGWRPQSSVGR